MEFKLTIKLGEACDAMHSSKDLACALRKVARLMELHEYVEAYPTYTETSAGWLARTLENENGNNVGRWSLSE